VSIGQRPPQGPAGASARKPEDASRPSNRAFLPARSGTAFRFSRAGRQPEAELRPCIFNSTGFRRSVTGRAHAPQEVDLETPPDGLFPGIKAAQACPRPRPAEAYPAAAHALHMAHQGPFQGQGLVTRLHNRRELWPQSHVECLEEIAKGSINKFSVPPSLRPPGPRDRSSSQGWSAQGWKAIDPSRGPCSLHNRQLPWDIPPRICKHEH